jgi:predicted nucleotidyltransferase
MQLNDVLELLSLSHDDVLNVYVLGSRVYGSHTADSDYDFMVVVANTTKLPEPCKTEHGEWLSHEEDGQDMSFKAYSPNSTQREMMMYRSDKVDITVYTVDMFQFALNKCLIAFLECIYLRHIEDVELRNSVLFKEQYEFALPSFSVNDPDNKLSVLRASISGEIDHSFIKAKKKITNENKILLGRRALFHALRVALFGLQIASRGYIYDFSEANELYRTLMYSNLYDESLSPADKWEELRRQFKPRLSDIQKQFRKLCPKK